MNKRGNSQDLVIVGLLLFGFAILAIPCLAIITNIITSLAAHAPPFLQALFFKFIDSSYWWIDAGFLLFYVILWSASMASAFFLDSSPVFYVIFFLLGTIALLALSPLMGFVLAILEGFPDVATRMPILVGMATYWNVFTSFFFITQIVALYAKRRLTENG